MLQQGCVYINWLFLKNLAFFFTKKREAVPVITRGCKIPFTAPEADQGVGHTLKEFKKKPGKMGIFWPSSMDLCLLFLLKALAKAEDQFKRIMSEYPEESCFCLAHYGIGRVYLRQNRLVWWGKKKSFFFEELCVGGGV